MNSRCQDSLYIRSRRYVKRGKAEESRKMKSKIFNRKIFNSLDKKGVSPVVATIVLVAVALVAAVSVGGYVTGLFGGFTSTQTISSATYVAGSSPVLSFSTGNTGSATNITQVILSGVGITGVYTWTPDAAWQFANPLGNGASSFTIQSSTSPTFAPGSLTNQGNAYSITVNLANGKSLNQNTIAK